MDNDPNNPNADTEQIVFGRTKSLTQEDLDRATVDPSTPKCDRMRRDIDAAQGDLSAAARRLATGDTPDNEYGLTD